MDYRSTQQPRFEEEPSSPPSSDFGQRPNSREKLSARTAHDLKSSTWWTPSYLRKVVLLTFVGTFTSFVIILAVLFAYSSQHHGLSTANDQEFYLWTYGPTAVLTCVAAVWAQVIYRIKQLMPWKAMADGPQPPSKSVLLDYISLASPIAMWKAVSNRHHIVSLVIVSSALLSATIIFSTGLFSLQYTDITKYDVPLAVTNKFDWSNFDWQNVDVRPTAVVYGTLLGLKYPDGTTAKYAVQNFTDVQGSNATIRATVDTFAAYLECEDATLTVTDVAQYERIGSQYTGIFTLNITSPTCTAAGVPFTTGPKFIFDALSPRNESHDITYGFARFGDCVEPDEHRMLISTGTIHVVEHWNGSEYGNIGLTLPWDELLHIQKSTTLFCKPHYRIAKSEVIKKPNATAGDVFESIKQSNEPEGPAILATKLARGVFQSINDPIAAAQGFYSPSIGSGDLTLADTFFTIMTQARTGSGNVSSDSDFWFQPENLRRYANNFFGSIAAQIASQKLLTRPSATTLGSVTVNKPRLFVRLLSFTLMEVGLVILALIAALLVFYTPRAFDLHDRGSISGIASVLAESPELCKLAKEKNSLTRSTFESELEKHTYNTRPESKRIGIEVSGPSTAIYRLARQDTPDQAPLHWWRPLVLNPISRLLAILAPLAYIIVLEVLFTVSKSRGGLIDVSRSSWTHYGWTYLPALAMVCLQTIYVSVAFYVRLLSPYATMKASPAQASISVDDHPLSRIALHEAFVTAKRRRFGVLAVTIAALLAPILTIAVSGLYTPENYHQDVAIRQLTTWNFASRPGTGRNATLLQNAFDQVHEPNPTNYSLGGFTSPFTDLVVTSNLSYPQWTFDELAFPLMQIEDQNSTTADDLTSLKGILDLPVSAIRGGLNCSVIPKANVRVTYDTYDSSPSAAFNETYSWAMAGNRQCLNFTPETGMQPNNGVNIPIPGCRMAMFQATSNISDDCIIAPQAVFLPPNTDHSQPFGYFAGQGYQAQYNSYYCPWYVGMIGSMTSEEIEDYTWFTCTTNVESVDTQTRFTLPDYSISTVQIDERSAKKVDSLAEIDVAPRGEKIHYVNVTGPNTALWSRNLALDPNGYLTYYNISSGQNYDNFFSALVYGRDGVPARELIGSANVPRLFHAVQHLWRVYLAQQFRTNMYVLSADPDDIKRLAPQQPLNGTLMDSNTYRLKQSEVSTRILQGILAALSLCAIITFFLLDSRAVLPCNPCSIAAVASLLAGSEMLDVMMASKENDDLDEQQHKWGGYFFSLGMWPQLGGAKRFGIDIGKAEKVSQPGMSDGLWHMLGGKVSHYYSKGK